MAMQVPPTTVEEFTSGVHYVCADCGGEVELEGRATWQGTGYYLTVASIASARCRTCDASVYVVASPSEKSAGAKGSVSSSSWDDLEGM